jgi:hypothetical protein
MTSKLDPLLESATDKLADADPGYLLDVVLTRADRSDLDSLLQYLREQGLDAKQVSPETVSSQVPVGRVRALADSDLVGSVRMARLHRMH